MLSNSSFQDKGLRFFRLRKVVTLGELATHLHCSDRTVQRRLSDWQAINSYNQNGRYYTLPDIPDFNAHGLWRYREAFFSRFGNLPKTLVQLIGASQAGLTAAEAGHLLGLRPSSFLWSFRDHPSLKREKTQGPYIYYSTDPNTYSKQRQQRLAMGKTTKPPGASEAIAILVQKIKEPSLNIEQLASRLKKKSLNIEPDRIRTLFAHHGLVEKKTPPSI